MVQLLAVWPELQIRAIELLTAIRNQDEEVVLLEGKALEDWPNQDTPDSFIVDPAEYDQRF